MSQYLETQCPCCRATLKLRSRTALGKKAPCPQCGEPFVVEERFPDDEFGDFTDEFDTGGTMSDYDYGDDDRGRDDDFDDDCRNVAPFRSPQP